MALKVDKDRDLFWCPGVNCDRFYSKSKLKKE